MNGNVVSRRPIPIPIKEDDAFVVGVVAGAHEVHAPELKRATFGMLE